MLYPAELRALDKHYGTRRRCRGEVLLGGTGAQYVNSENTFSPSIFVRPLRNDNSIRNARP